MTTKKELMTNDNYSSYPRLIDFWEAIKLWWRLRVKKDNNGKLQN